jgi:hypothetical protein
MGKCIYCGKNISWIDADTKCNHGNGWLQDHSMNHTAHQKCCMRNNIITLSKEQQEQCKHDYVNCADSEPYNWMFQLAKRQKPDMLLNTTFKCKKCGHEVNHKSLF